MNTLINIFSYLGYVGAASVFIGAVFEGAELIVKLGRKKKYRKLFGKDKRREIVSCIKFLKPRILPFEAIGFAMMVLGLAVEWLGSGTAELMQSKENSALLQQIAETQTNVSKIDPVNLPVLNINAFAVLRVKGKDFPDLTQWDSSALSTNWGSKNATLQFCGNAPNSILSSMPSMIADDFGTGTGFSDSREYFLNFRLESVSAAMYLPMQSASKSLGAANFISLDVKFLPPQSEILGGYAFVVVNNSLWKLFRIYPQKDKRQPFPNKAQADFLSKIPPIKGFFMVKVTGQKEAVAGTTISTLEPGKYTSLTNGEMVPEEGTFFPPDFPVVGTNVPSGKIDATW